MKKEFIYKGRKLDFYTAEVRLPNGRVVEREVADHPGAVVVLPILDNGNVVLEDHYRFIVGGNLLEAPAGTLEAGEEPESCARRELLEETGLCAGEMTALGAFYTSPGVLTEVIHSYLARKLVRGERELEDDEVLEPVEMPFEEALRMAASGRIRDAKTIATLFLAERFLEAEKHGARR